MCTSKSWRKSTPTPQWQSTYTKKQPDQHQERSTTGDTLSPKLFGCIRKHIPTTDLGNQRLEIRQRISESSSLRRRHTHMRYCTTCVTMLQELADESENQVLKMNKSKTKVMMENHSWIYVSNYSDKEHWKLHLPGTEIQHQKQKPRQGDSKKNHGRMDSIRQAPPHLQG